MSREEALRLLAEYKRWGDPERAHSDADEILCRLLTDLGYADVVEAWAKIDKWYA